MESNQMIINAFNKDYMKKHEPKFMDSFIKSSQGSITMSRVVEEKRKLNPNHGTLLGISKIVDDQLKPRDFMVYSRVGAPKK
jgi:hypothetical protein